MSEEKTKEQGRSFLRLLLFEALALGGYLYLLHHPVTQLFWNQNFRINALAFLAAFPLLFLYRWKVAEGCLGLVLFPLGWVLSLGLGVSCYLWLACGFYYAGSPFYASLTKHEAVLGLLFALVYFPLLEPILGVSKKYFPLHRILWILLFAGLGGFLGYLVGQFVIRKAGLPTGDNAQLFLLWLALVLIGVAVGALGAQRKGGGS
jgi:hypothetical protein